MTVVTVDDVMTAAETLSLEDKRILHTRLSDLCKAEFDLAARTKALEFRHGDLVSFYNTKEAIHISGKVVKVNPKNIVVETRVGRYGIPSSNPVRWTVSPGLLKKVIVPVPA